MSLKHLAVGAAVYAALLVAAPAAFAQTAQSGYSEPAGSVQQQIGRDDPRANVEATRTRVTATDRDSGGLPFTGLDLALIAGAGGMLLAVGVTVRRLVDSTTA
jgi:hypothetical protein